MVKKIISMNLKNAGIKIVCGKCKSSLKIMLKGNEKWPNKCSICEKEFEMPSTARKENFQDEWQKDWQKNMNRAYDYLRAIHNSVEDDNFEAFIEVEIPDCVNSQS